jgi:hypothetical protein
MRRQSILALVITTLLMTRTTVVCADLSFHAHVYSELRILGFYDEIGNAISMPDGLIWPWSDAYPLTTHNFDTIDSGTVGNLSHDSSISITQQSDLLRFELDLLETVYSPPLSRTGPLFYMEQEFLFTNMSRTETYILDYRWDWAIEVDVEVGNPKYERYREIEPFVWMEAEGKKYDFDDNLWYFKYWDLPDGSSSLHFAASDTVLWRDTLIPGLAPHYNETITHIGRIGGGEFESNNPVPVPAAVLLGSIGLSFSGWLLRRRRASH